MSGPVPPQFYFFIVLYLFIAQPILLQISFCYKYYE